MTDIQKKPLAYLAGPYSADPVHYTRQAVLWAELLYRDNYAVIIPHLTMLQDLICFADKDAWLERDIQQLMRCDIVFTFDDETPSPGRDNELMVATEIGIPVYPIAAAHDVRAGLEF